LDKEVEYGNFLTDDNKEIPYKKWIAKSSIAHANVIAIHGLGSYLENFNALGEYFVEKGVNVFAIELRGFGRWKYSGKWSYHEFDSLVSDLNVFISKVQSDNNVDLPVFILGDSLGCLISILHMLGYPNKFKGAIFASPFFIKPPYKLITFPLFLLKYLVGDLQIRIVKNLSRLTKNQDFIAFDRELNLGAKSVSFELLYEVVKLSIKCEKQLKKNKISCPFFVAVGEKDVLVNWKNLSHIVKRLATLKQFKVYKEGHHLLLNDLPNSQVFKDMVDFIHSVLTETK